jgi:TIR domain/Pentapeptide repeats (8 copies)
MANPNHIEQLRQGVDSWNEWVRTQRMRGGTPTRHAGAKVGVGGFYPDLSSADLIGMDLYQGKPGAGFTGIDLIGANLMNANLGGAQLAWSNLTGATLEGANLTNVTLMSARLEGANLAKTNLTDALLGGANLLGANLSGANLDRAYLYETLFSDTNLADARGLKTCRYAGPCTVDHRTLFDYGTLPQEFLQGVGLPESLITYLPSLASNGIHYSCFISYSNKDHEFAQKLYTFLQAKGVRCWFAPHDLPIGAKTWDSIDQAIEVQDKLLLVLSKNSIASDWVEDEVSKAFAEERSRGTIVLFPIRIDDHVMMTDEAWARKLRDQRNIGDFQSWLDDKAFNEACKRILKDLQKPPLA